MQVIKKSQMEESVTGTGSSEGSFVTRHVGPSSKDVEEMVSALGCRSLDDFIARIVPNQIQLKKPLSLTYFQNALSEREALCRLQEIAKKNRVFRSYLGQGYYGCITPPVIQRNILENPGWYTQYTPYQPEISQGRLEALLNFQTMVCDLTGLAIANASLLDEGTAAAEALMLSYAVREKQSDDAALQSLRFVVSSRCHPQTIAVVKTRAAVLGIEVIVDDVEKVAIDKGTVGVLVQYPDTYGRITDFSKVAERAHASSALFIVAADILALTVLKPPAEFGADIAIGSTQRFGVPMGFGGPHAAYFAVRDEYKRLMPGRLIGVSKDRRGKSALRLALQTREQHIRREKATSNICTAQVLLAIMASMYAVYHGPKGIRAIAEGIQRKAARLAATLAKGGLSIAEPHVFDTVTISLPPGGASVIVKRAEARELNLRVLDAATIALSIDETTSDTDLSDLAEVFLGERVAVIAGSEQFSIPKELQRTSSYLTHEVFNRYHSETEFLRYIRRLEARDLSLGTAMIPLGSCTMKLNATSEMLPVTWPEFGQLHPFTPANQTAGYYELCTQLEKSLAEITGFDAVSLQPNSGAQGEYTGLLAIHYYHRSRGETERNVCLIPKSAHGTNPASAAMVGMRVVVVDCDQQGNVDLSDLRAKVAENRANLSALMVTYPSTHGVFEESIKEICEIVHAAGGQVYMDGANLNAQVGITSPGSIGADVCHINLHKTFCIPHGGGGPGMGPIGVRAHLAPFLPGHPVINQNGREKVGPVSAAPWGSASILTISWMYMAMMGAENLTYATKIAMLNANYLATRLSQHFPVLYRGKNGLNAHECIFDLRPLKKSSSVEAEDVAKRLMDYGFHAPTVSFPVAGTLMVEPTESESKEELDRFCDAMIAIRKEIAQIESGALSAQDNPLKNAPHTALDIADEKWEHPYSRETAVFPASWTMQYKFWPSVNRIDGSYGDRNLICSCPPLESYR